MVVIERQGIGAGFADTGTLESQPPHTWRSDPFLDEPFRAFCRAFEAFQNGIGPQPRLNLSERYISSVLELIDPQSPFAWGPQDQEIRQIGADEHGFPILAHDLYRGGRAERVATIVPHVGRYDEVVRVDSPDQAADIFQILFEVRNRRLAESYQSRLVLDRAGQFI